MLTWIHIYAFSRTQSTSSAATSIRIYYEVAQARDFLTPADPAYYNGKVPLGVSIFPQELAVTPRM